jgi:hypothetical protein
MTLADDIARYCVENEIAFQLMAGGETARTIAAGLEREKIIIDRADVEAVELRRNGEGIDAGSGPESCHARDSENPNWLWNHGINALALSLHLEVQQSAARESEARLQARRDELAGRYADGLRYDEAGSVERQLIDYALSLEDAAAGRDRGEA